MYVKGRFQEGFRQKRACMPSEGIHNGKAPHARTCCSTCRSISSRKRTPRNVRCERARVPVSAPANPIMLAAAPAAAPVAASTVAAVAAVVTVVRGSGASLVSESRTPSAARSAATRPERSPSSRRGASAIAPLGSVGGWQVKQGRGGHREGRERRDRLGHWRGHGWRASHLPNHASSSSSVAPRCRSAGVKMVAPSGGGTRRHSAAASM